MTYLLWLALFIWLPTIILWAMHYQLLTNYKKTLAFVLAAALIFTIPWDVWAVGRGLWTFPAGKNLGMTIINLPLEEYLFFTSLTLLIATATLIAKLRSSR